MKNHYPLFIFVLLLSFTACNNKQKENAINEGRPEVTAKIDNRIDSISVLYYNYLVESQTPVKPEEIKLNIPQFDKDRKGVLDAHIVDSIKIEDIRSRIDSLKPAQSLSTLDARLVAVIKYKDGRKDILCLGGYQVNEIFLNGVQQETDNKLLFLLKNHIGFYPWMIGDDMFAMKELQDPSFAKAPFVSTPYYDAYQSALAKR